jgi:hypothetical protein
MYFIIETEEQLSKLPVEESCFVQLIPLNDNYHPSLTTTSLLYYRTKDKGYILPVNHSEAYPLKMRQIAPFLSAHKKVYVLDAKFHSYFLDLPNYIDLNFVQLDQENEHKIQDCSTILHRDFKHRLKDREDINTLIPITKHYQRCECLYESVSKYIGQETNVEYQRRTIRAYKKVEQVGISVSRETLLSSYQLKDPNYSLAENTIYTSYNLYNLTGRPTNSFNNVNFLAIPKEGEFRSCFVPREEYLVELDFDAYHLRIIAKLTGYKFPNPKESVHEYLGKQYFNKSTITEAEYKEAKTISFRQLYGGVESRYKNIPFLNNLSTYIEARWKEYTQQGQIELPTGRILKMHPEMSATKLFNYIIQSEETRINVGKLNRIHDLIEQEEYKSRIIMVTYDSFLLDFAVEDGKEVLVEIKRVLEEGGFVIKHKYGESYQFS